MLLPDTNINFIFSLIYITDLVNIEAARNCICLYYLEIYFMRTQVVYQGLDYVNVDT